MNASIPIAPTADPKLDALLSVLFSPMEADGVYARTGLYEGVVDALTDFVTAQRAEGTEVYRFPPVMSRRQLERSGYLDSFPNLLGCVSCLTGSERDIRSAAAKLHSGGDWTDGLVSADLILTPASCYPVYPIAAARGVVPQQGYVFDVGCDCFRREPSKDIDRLQSFRMREYVRIGSPQQIAEFRHAWIDRAKGMADSLGLPYTVEVASDPFFGRGGQIMAVSQIEQNLKFELLVPVMSQDKPTACMSFNYHQDHFGEAWGLHGEDGSVMHTGCVAFGMDRLAVAMFAVHGLDVAAWPAGVKDALGV